MAGWIYDDPMIRIVPIAALALLPATLAAQQVAIANYQTPTIDSSPWAITSGPDGALWFTETVGNSIGRITTAAAITEYPIPTAYSAPEGIASGPDGALWFTEREGNKIGRITTAGAITEFPIPTAYSHPQGITAGPDGALWFAELHADKIGRIATNGVITEYAVPLPARGPSAITAGPDGALWFTAGGGGGSIGRVTTSGVFTEFPAPGGSGIVAGPDGALWFTNSIEVGRMTTTGTMTFYTVDAEVYGTPVAITSGPDGALWFTQSIANVNSLGRITTTGEISEYPVPTGLLSQAFAVLYGITVGPDGKLWFTEAPFSKIGEAVSVSTNLSVSPASGACDKKLTFSGSGYRANERVQIYASGVDSQVIASATADASGSFTATGAAPQAPFGPRLFLGVGQTSGDLGAASFSVTAKVTLNPNAGTPGSTVTAQGCGFGATTSQTINLYWDNPRTFLGTTTIDANGTFTGKSAFTFTVPAGSPAGSDGVIANVSGSNVRGYGHFTVE